MELDIGTVDRTSIYEWHDWYAWRPVVARHELTDTWKLVWLKPVERVWAFSLVEGGWAYRVKR